MGLNQRVPIMSVALAILVGVAAATQIQSSKPVQSQQTGDPAVKIISPNNYQASDRTKRHIHDESEIIDLSHPLHNKTLHWPRNQGVQVFMNMDQDNLDPNNKTYHVRSDSISMAIHAGTHIDAPAHFSKDGWSVDQIPLSRLIDVPVTVIDLSAKVKANRSYSFTVDDFMKDGQPLVRPNTIVLVYTGISLLYDEGNSGYLGYDGTGSLNQMKSPGFSLEAANYLIGQGVFGVGLDAISADSSERQRDENKYDPQSHVAFNSKNVFILENVSKNLAQLIGKQAKLTIAPLRVVNGTGSPIRLVAVLGHGDDDHVGHATNGASSLSLGYTALIALLASSLAAIIF